jgi:hypothetical protein
MSAGQAQPIEIQIIPRSSDFRPNDLRWLQQVDLLLNDLKRQSGDVRQEVIPVPGKKGGAQAIILALGTSGAITAAVTIFRIWLARSADRTLRIQGSVGDRVIDLEINGKNISEDTLRQALGVASDS